MRIGFSLFCVFMCFITFIMLMAQVNGTISIPWIWIFAPIWIPVALVVGIFIVLLITAAIIEGCSQKNEK